MKDRVSGNEAKHKKGKKEIDDILERVKVNEMKNAAKEKYTQQEEAKAKEKANTKNKKGAKPKSEAKR
jgi:hypothetical protein